jgi:hypothetical protein
MATKQDVSPLTTKLGTFHWPPSLGFSLTSFLLLFKGVNLDHLSFSFRM